MKELKKCISFIDKNHNRFKIDMEITKRNGYDEFTASGEWGGSMGQCLDEIKPANTDQKELVSLWKKYHLKGNKKPLPPNFDKSIEALCERILDAEKKRRSKGGNENCADMDEEDLIEYITESSLGVDEQESEKYAALGVYLNLTKHDVVADIEQNGNRWTVQGTEYLFGTDEEMDEEWENELENYVEQCVLPEIPEHYRKYFNEDSWKDDAKEDGRAHALNRYDGREEEIEFYGTKYFIYRT
jgi:hypothetical protein